jgi:hypothetical protein
VHSILYISPTHGCYALKHLIHCCKNVKENYCSLTGQKNSFRGPYVAHACFKVLLYRNIIIMLRKKLTNLQMGFLYVSKFFTKPRSSEMLLKFSYWIWGLPRFPNSFYPDLAVRLRAGSKFILALIFSPIRNRKTVLQRMKTDCKCLRRNMNRDWGAFENK